jgi:signal transduction histidine kinase
MSAHKGEPRNRDRLIVNCVRVTAALGLTMAVMGSVIFLGARHFELFIFQSGASFAAPFAIFFSVFAWMVIPRQPRNAVIWVMAISGLCWGLYAAGAGVFSVVFSGDAGMVYTSKTIAPADLPPAAAWVLTFTFLGWVPGMFSLTTLGLLLFPDGKLPSPRWRWVGAVAILSLTVGTIVGSWGYRPGSTTAYNSDTAADPSAITLLLVLSITSLISLAALVRRFQHSDGETRQQFKWVVWGASFFLAAVLPGFLLQDGDYESVSTLLFYVGGAVLLASYGIAIAKYRLYDVDVVISKTFVYGSLAVFITVVYVTAVVGLGQLIGSSDRPSPLLSIAATGVVAIAFQPLRRRLQRLANRIVYGRRSTPYEVLSSFSQGISAVDSALLVQIARSLAEGTTADSASIWVDRTGSPQCLAVWPASPSGNTQFDAVSAPVIHDGEELGRVLLEIPPGQPFPVTDQRLLDQVAGGLGLALRNLQLTDDLRQRVDELAASRRRIVSVQDDTRRKLERDLHDGAQQRLVALKIKLSIGSAMAHKAGLEDVKTVLDGVRDETDHTIDTVRDFARGIYPPLLEAEGLGAALSAHARKMAIPVTVQAAGLSRYPKEQEATVYFCVLEALQNAMRHSDASSVNVTLRDRDGNLTFEVRDDGVGFDESSVLADGLVNMTDRVEAIGGSLNIDTGPNRGTIVSGSIPIAVLAAR